MIDTYFFGVEMNSVERDWRDTLKGVLLRLQNRNENIRNREWFQADEGLIKEALIPQMEYMIHISNSDETLVNITKKVADYFIQNPKYRRPDQQKKTILPFPKVSGESDGYFSTLIRIVDIYKGLLLVHQTGPVNTPISMTIGNNYFRNYLRYVVGLKNYLYYDGSQRKNIIRELLPDGIQSLNENFKEINHLENRFFPPEELSSEIWMERWEKLEQILDLWNRFFTSPNKYEGEAKRKMEFDIHFANDKNNEKYRITDPEALVYRLLDKRQPKPLDLTSEEYTVRAKEHFRKIKDIARYAKNNHLAFVRFYF